MSRVVGEYLRSRDGKTIHLAPCSAAGKAVPWRYADSMSLHQVAATVASIQWLALCRRCWPTDAHHYADGPRP